MAASKRKHNNTKWSKNFIFSSFLNQKLRSNSSLLKMEMFKSTDTREEYSALVGVLSAASKLGLKFKQF